jgi:hypothetical protein
VIAQHRGIILLAFLLAAGVMVAANTPVASAQSCNASLGTSSLSSTQYYYNSYIGVNTPVSVSCSYYAGQLYIVGNAFDTSSNVNLGSVSTTLTPTYGGYSGHLTFNLPPSVFGHEVRLLVSVYGGPNGYYGNSNGQLLAQAAQMVKLTVNYQNGYPYGNCNSAYGCYGNNQNYYCQNGMYCYPAYYCNGNYQNCYQNGVYCNNSYCYTYQPSCYYYNGYNYYYQTDCTYYRNHHR